MTGVVPVVDFVSLTEKAKQLSERRTFLQAQEAALSKQIDAIQASLVKDYGEDYMSVFNTAVENIKVWDSSMENKSAEA